MPRKGRIAGSFALLFVFFIVLGLFSTSGFDRISVSFRSMYEDRLIPSLDIGNLILLVYENRVSLENHITTTDAQERHTYEVQLQQNHRAIDSLIRKITNTYLVPEEKADLGRFNSTLSIYREAEQNMLRMSREMKTDSALKLLTHDGDKLFHASVEPLQKLGKDQQKVGEELYNESQSIAQNQKTLAYSIMIAAVFAGVIFAFALTFKHLENQ